MKNISFCISEEDFKIINLYFKKNGINRSQFIRMEILKIINNKLKRIKKS